MSHTAVTLEDLLSDFDETAAKWKQFFAANRGAAEVVTDIANRDNIGSLVWHIYAASVRHSERLLGEPVTDLEGILPQKNLDSAWELQSRAAANLRRFLESTDDAALNEVFHFQTRVGGEASASRRKICLHIFVHAMRHWAQIGSVVRQHGFPPNWPQDILFSKAIE
jgi:uncharacterized damage-inducible protein DinB